MTTQVMKSDMIITNRRISFCSGVMPVLGFEVSFAMRPKIVLSPVATQIPRQLPLIPGQRVSVYDKQLERISSRTMRALEANVVRLKIVIFGCVDRRCNWFGFTCVALDMINGCHWAIIISYLSE
jgi:hypothetical protein